MRLFYEKIYKTIDFLRKQRYNIKCIALTGLTVCVRSSEKRRLVRAFIRRAGAPPELPLETRAYFCVKDV